MFRHPTWPVREGDGDLHGDRLGSGRVAHPGPGGTTFAPGTFTGAIIGGTGKYAGAGGTFIVRQTGDNSPMVDTFHIQIPKK